MPSDVLRKVKQKMGREDAETLREVTNVYLLWLDMMTEGRVRHCRLLDTSLFAMRKEEVAELKQWIHDIGITLGIEGGNLPFNKPRGKEPTL